MPTIALLWCLLGLAPISTHLRIDLVFNGPKLPRDVKTAAMEEASRIWKAYDVELHESSAQEAGRDGAIRLSVAVAPRPARNVAPDALGSIYFVDGLPTALILLYPNTISALVPWTLVMSPGVHERSPFSYDRVLGRVAGRALAHEIGHFLLRSRQHSEHGLMRAKPQMNELIDLSRRGFALADEDVRRLALLVAGRSTANQRAAPAHEELAFGDVLAPLDCGVIR